MSVSGVPPKSPYSQTPQSYEELSSRLGSLSGAGTSEIKDWLTSAPAKKSVDIARQGDTAQKGKKKAPVPAQEHLYSSLK